jgi:sugar/nucleoside kinase (ribokinase family)
MTMTDAGQRFDVATIGNYTKDTIVTASGTQHADGGGFNYSAFAAASLGRKVVAVTRLAAEDLPRVVRSLEEAGITVLATETPSSTLMRLEYPTANVDQRVLTVAATAGSFTAEQVRPIDAKAIIISPSFRGEFPIEVIRDLRRKDAVISADAQGFIRVRHEDGHLSHEAWPERDEVLSLLDILKADAVEAEALTGESDIRVAARALAALGPREVVITHRNGILVYAEGEIFSAKFRAASLVGRSGRGDTCIGSYIAARLDHPPGEAILWSAAVTSLKMEAVGPIRRRYEDIVDLVEREYKGAMASGVS